MKFKNWMRYLAYSIVIIFLVFIKEYVNQKVRAAYESPIDSVSYMKYILTPFFFNLLIGIVLGAEHLIGEIKKAGTFVLNIPKLTLLGIPSLIFSLFYLWGLMKIKAVWQFLTLFSISGTTFIPIFQMILGYTVITSFCKRVPDNIDTNNQ